MPLGWTAVLGLVVVAGSAIDTGPDGASLFQVKKLSDGDMTTEMHRARDIASREWTKLYNISAPRDMAELAGELAVQRPIDGATLKGMRRRLLKTGERGGVRKVGGIKLKWINVVADILLVLGNLKNVICPGPLWVLVWWILGTATMVVDEKHSWADAILLSFKESGVDGFGAELPPEFDEVTQLRHAAHMLSGMFTVVPPSVYAIDWGLARITRILMKEEEVAKEKRSRRFEEVFGMEVLAWVLVSSVVIYAGSQVIGHATNQTGLSFWSSIYTVSAVVASVSYNEIRPNSTAGKILAGPWTLLTSRLGEMLRASTEYDESKDPPPWSKDAPIYKHCIAGSIPFHTSF